MKSNRRSQAERAAATRDALIAAGRSLFAQHGFAGVGAEAIVRAAGLTRGALYHHFADKTELFAAVFEAVEAGVVARIAAEVEAARPADALAAMRLAAGAWLDAAIEPQVLQIVLVDGPAVLGWARWREIGGAYGMALTQGLLRQAIAAGAVPDQPVAPLAHVLLGAVREGAMYLAAADDRALARREVGTALDHLVAALAHAR